MQWVIIMVLPSAPPLIHPQCSCLCRPVDLSSYGGVLVEDDVGTLLTIAYLRMNEEPVSRMRDMLHQYFTPDRVERDFSLAISTGRDGARLTHNHARQFQFGMSLHFSSHPRHSRRPRPNTPHSLVPCLGGDDERFGDTTN
jgi:hypothetical protein